MHSRLRSLGVVLLAISPVGYLACSEDAATSSPTSGDAGATATSDASSAVEQDAGDAAADSGSKTVTVTTVRRSTDAPEPGASVVFYDAAGAVTATVTTDANGVATGELAGGGQVTAVFGTATSPRLVTFLGVEPGDRLTALDDDGPGAFSLAVTPPATPFAGTTSLMVVAGACFEVLSGGTAGGTTTTTLDRGCFYPGAGSTVYLVARNASGAAIASTELADLALKTDGTPTAAAFTKAWTAIGAAATVTATGVPTSQAPGMGGTRVGLTHLVGSGRGATHGVSIRTIAADAPTYAVQFDPTAAPAPTFQQDEVDLIESQGSAPHGIVKRARAVRGAVAATTTLGLDGALPRITGVTVTGAAAPSLTFTSEASLASTKGLLAMSYFSTTGGYGSWVVISPATATPATVAPLPASLAAFAPAASSSWFGFTLAAVGGTAIADYAALRASAALVAPAAGLVNAQAARSVPLLPADGTVELSAWTQNL